MQNKATENPSVWQRLKIVAEAMEFSSHDFLVESVRLQEKRIRVLEDKVSALMDHEFKGVVETECEGDAL